MKWIVFGILLLVSILFLFWPVCVAIPSESLKGFAPPIEMRVSERGMIWKTWQQKNGNWYQCKSRFERLGFN